MPWLWWSRGPLARLVRAALLVPAGLYGVVMRTRARVYEHGWLPIHALPLPAVGVGALAVGGSGKTPLAAWIAAFYARRGMRPGILLRGYGHDEPLVHRRLVPEAVVVPDPDRVAGARAARDAGARILVLDDAFQRLDVARDVNIAVVGTEQAVAPPWPVPAGPWREGTGALARAHLIVVTRRLATLAEAATIVERLGHRFPRTPIAVARLEPVRFEGMQSGTLVPRDRLAGRRLLAVAGVADPVSFAGQLRELGAQVEVASFRDHHTYGPRDVARLARAAERVDYVVVTEKDAVKLRARWPAHAGEPLVAALEVEWELNGSIVERTLVDLAARAVAS